MMTARMTEGQRLSELALAVRESTLRRLKAVPEGSENWRPTPESMSFAEVARHLIDSDEWVLRNLNEPDPEPITGRAGGVKIEGRTAYLELLGELEAIGLKRAQTLHLLPDERMSDLMFDRRFDGEVTVWWIIARGNLDHEIHHRGQIAAYLRMVE